MRWLYLKDVNELKSLGKFTDIKQEINHDLNNYITIKARGWNDLFNKIILLRNFVEQLSNKEISSTSLNLHKECETSVDNQNYFTSKSNEYIFYLTELDGEIRMKKLGITKSLFSNKSKAKTWRDKISKEIHPDITTHPKSDLAMSVLNEMYSSMVGKNRK